MRREARAAGIDSNGLIFAARLEPIERHIARLAVADLFLDSYPYGAHTTANDALLAGPPLITHAGATLASRFAMPKLVTSNSADYEALARCLATTAVSLPRCARGSPRTGKRTRCSTWPAAPVISKESMRRIWREFVG